MSLPGPAPGDHPETPGQLHSTVPAPAPAASQPGPAFTRLLIANRAEVAVRVARAASELGLVTVAVYSEDDAQAPHCQHADHAVALPGMGAAAYLDIAALLRIAGEQGCDAVHPGWGYLSERADFAQACADAGLVFVGPTPAQLVLFGDKARSRALAQRLQVPVLPGCEAANLDEVRAFFEQQRRQSPGCALMLKAVHGGGGRGMRVVEEPADLDAAWARCRSEAKAAFGDDALYAERLLRRARHVEVQVLGDGQQVMALGERECTLQRRFQKLVEMAPSPGLDAGLRTALVQAALQMADDSDYQGLGTFEFLIDADAGSDADADANADAPAVAHADADRRHHSGNAPATDGAARGAVPPDVGSASPDWYFIECNPRLQVEHTVTEAVTGVDLVQAQLRLAAGARLLDMGLDPAAPPAPRGCAMQWRINAESTGDEGQPLPASGRIDGLRWPQGPGLRVDSHAETGFSPSPHHDSLLGKLVVHHGGGYAAALERSRLALAACRIEGLNTNLALLRQVAGHAALATPQRLHTRWLQQQAWPREPFAYSPQGWSTAIVIDSPVTSNWRAGEASGLAASAPLQSVPPPHAGAALPDEPGLLRAPMAGRVVSLGAAEGGLLGPGADAVVLEAMKMEHVLTAPQAMRVLRWLVQPGDFVVQGQGLLMWRDGGADCAQAPGSAGEADLDQPRADLQRLHERTALTADAARPQAVARRHAAGGRTARENIADLCDAGSFNEYGALAIAAQTRRRAVDELQRQTPADGMVTGIGSVNAAQFGPGRSRCVVMAYDYTVLAGTQGMRNHAKTDRMLSLASQLKLPLVLFAEGGGGRPGDTDSCAVAGLNVSTFRHFAALSGQVPVLGLVHGRCFAGNAALLGCCDLIVATRASNIGMGGPAMIEGGGLGVFAPEAIGPADVQQRNGVIDLLVDDEAAAVAAARQLLGLFQGPTTGWSAGDPRLLRHAVPENRLRVYDVRQVLAQLCDEGSVVELRPAFGIGIITALARIAGRPVGLMANNPMHLGGAIDADAADKAARFMQLCEARRLPLVSLCDTPGFMVGPDIERAAQVRHVCRMYVVAANLSVPCFTVVLRKGYGLGAMAMASGGFDAPVFNVSWPTGEFGGMGLEGAVRLGWRKELEAAAEGVERDALYRKLLDQKYAEGSALSMAQALEIDAVIDPADTRSWLLNGLDSAAALTATAQTGRQRYIDCW